MDARDLESLGRGGYLFVRSLFSPNETAAINHAVKTSRDIAASGLGLADRDGGTIEIALWRSLDDDLFGACRDRVALSTVSKRCSTARLISNPSKLTLKKPRTGGAWDWHQDLGYW